jgi:hypothetical protein
MIFLTHPRLSRHYLPQATNPGATSLPLVSPQEPLTSSKGNKDQRNARCTRCEGDQKLLLKCEACRSDPFLHVATLKLRSLLPFLVIPKCSKVAPRVLAPKEAIIFHATLPRHGTPLSLFLRSASGQFSSPHPLSAVFSPSQPLLLRTRGSRNCCTVVVAIVWSVSTEPSF